MKFIAVLVLTILVTVAIGTIGKKFKSEGKSELISPLVSGVSSSIDQAVDKNTSIFGWQVFTNNYYGYKIKHPSDVKINNLKNGDISFEKSNLINIFITLEFLSKNDTIYTVIESAINEKSNSLKDKFNLVNSISPIAIGSVTAQTYTSKENGKSITYYYVPQKEGKYLLITNASSQDSSLDYLTSEDIIYSLEFLP
jgi:hypothetical protein